MSIRKIINLVENAMPSVEDIEGEIAPDAPMTTSSKEFNPPQLIDRSGQIRPFGQETLDRVVADGWVALIYVDKGWRVTVKLDGHKVTRDALTKAIEILEASSAGDLRIEDLTTRIPQNFSGWTRAGGLAILKTLLRKIKAIRAIGGDPKPGRIAYGGIPGAFDVAEASLRENYLLALMESTEDEAEEEEKEAEPEAEKVEEGLVGDVLTRMIATGLPDKEILALLERAQVCRQAAKMARKKPQKSTVPGWGDGEFYDKEEHTLVMKVFRNFKNVHKTGRKNEAIMADFDKYAKRAGYHGPRPILAPDGINARVNEGSSKAEVFKQFMADREGKIDPPSNQPSREKAQAEFTKDHQEKEQVDETLLMDYRSLFLRAFDRQPKNEVGFDRAADEARLTADQREEMKAEVLSLAESLLETEDSVKASDCSVGEATSVGKLVFDIRVTCGDKYADIRVKAATAEEAKKKVLTQDRLDMARWKTKPVSETVEEDSEEIQEAQDLKEFFRMFGDEGGSWKRWTGGPCPVDEGEIVHYKTRGGRKSAGPAGRLNWANDGEDPADDIIAYAQ